MKRLPERIFGDRLGLIGRLAALVVAAGVIGGVLFFGCSPSPSDPPPGCFPAGTQCRVAVQNEVYCCGGQQVTGRSVGWCIGWWDGIPCR